MHFIPELQHWNYIKVSTVVFVCSVCGFSWTLTICYEVYFLSLKRGCCWSLIGRGADGGCGPDWTLQTSLHSFGLFTKSPYA